MPHQISQKRISKHCSTCFEKQLRIDELEEEIKGLKQKLYKQKQIAKEGFFGSSTSSSKVPVKPNTERKFRKKRGAKIGHRGNSRKSHSESEVDEKHLILCNFEDCPECGNKLQDKGFLTRSVLDSPPNKPVKVSFRIQKKYCSQCRKTYQKQPPGVLEKGLFGNQLIVNMAEMHYLHGIPVGRISELTGVGDGSILSAFKRLSGIFKDVLERLVGEYRQAEVKHADETGWRTDGKNGYSWLFATNRLSLFQYGETRSSAVPKRIFGKDPLPGVLVVDRYAAYNKVPCKIQYCYSHLIRDIEDLQKRHPEEIEVENFVAVLIPLMATAVKLRKQPVGDEEFLFRAKQVELEIKKLVDNPARHLGIKRVQELFRENETRLFHWASNRAVSAENNLSERDLRPTVIARKVSFGSTSLESAKTRSILTSLFHTLRKRVRDPSALIKRVLDRYAQDKNFNPADVLLENPIH